VEELKTEHSCHIWLRYTLCLPIGKGLSIWLSPAELLLHCFNCILLLFVMFSIQMFFFLFFFLSFCNVATSINTHTKKKILKYQNLKTIALHEGDLLNLNTQVSVCCCMEKHIFIILYFIYSPMSLISVLLHS
jgi:hypothetical protein